ncbi:MAG: hypothetical protein Q7U53_17405 [Anaerolineaceae bacterium]|nr:hypothetical protein [Anaerolineaceae bacterium]
MKIRTDFVTNSSCASSLDVIVDNPVLLEILQKYKDMGVFGDSNNLFEIGSLENGNSIKTFVYKHGTEKTSFLLTGLINLEDVLGTIIEIMSTDDEDFENQPFKYDQDLYKMMEEELYRRREEIESSYLEVKYRASDDSYGSEIEPGEEREWIFNYDPVNGAEYSVERWEEEE